MGSIDIHERKAKSLSGLGGIAVSILMMLVGLIVFGAGVNGSPALIVVGGIIALVGFMCLFGLYSVQPNKAALLSLFGDYRGTDHKPGLRWSNPLYMKKKMSLRTRNFTTQTSKVNDARGNPIEIAAVVVWRVDDTAVAMYGVDDYVNYVHTQSESAVRHIARKYPYDAFNDDDVTTLIGDTTEVAHDLLLELQERAADAGVKIIEARITDLAYAPEIAEAMLRRQQAEAIVAARAKIVEGAVLMVRDAVRELQSTDEDGEAIPFDADRRTTFASNLMTVIVSDSPSTPVVNVGTLHR